MEINSLGLIERFFIIRCCKRDIKNNCFQEYTYYDEELRENKIYLSPFISTELSYFISKRTKKLEKKIILVNIAENNSLLGFRLMRMKKALCLIDEKINAIEHNINYTNVKYNRLVKILEYKNEEYKINNAEHNAQLCVEKILSLRSEEQSKLYKKKKRMIMLGYEKIRIINNINSEINAAKAYCVFRIQYYYDYACTHTTSLPTRMFTNKDLEVFSGEKIGDEHTGIFEKTNNKIQEILSEINGGSSDLEDEII